MAEIASRLAKDPETVEFYKKEAERYDKEKKEIKVKAEALDEESKKANEMSEKVYRPHHQLALAVTLIQISISLASITALTRRRWLFIAAIATAVGGGGLWLVSLTGIG